jgi:hypothetical protein
MIIADRKVLRNIIRKRFGNKRLGQVWKHLQGESKKLYEAREVAVAAAESNETKIKAANDRYDQANKVLQHEVFIAPVKLPEKAMKVLPETMSEEKKALKQDRKDRKLARKNANYTLNQDLI